MTRSRIAILITCLLCLAVATVRRSVAAESPRIVDGSSVTFMYRITVPGDGKAEALYFGQFVQGHHQLLPALERVVMGMKSGDEKKVELSPDEGFGPYDAKKKKIVPRTELPAGTQEGDVLEDRAGKEMTVTQLSGSSAVVDYNHPLAGKPLSVKIQILEVEDPS